MTKHRSYAMYIDNLTIAGLLSAIGLAAALYRLTRNDRPATAGLQR